MLFLELIFTVIGWAFNTAFALLTLAWRVLGVICSFLPDDETKIAPNGREVFWFDADYDRHI